MSGVHNPYSVLGPTAASFRLSLVSQNCKETTPVGLLDVSGFSFEDVFMISRFPDTPDVFTNSEYAKCDLSNTEGMHDYNG